jgi:AraC-like DNA-binding protein
VTNAVHAAFEIQLVYSEFIQDIKPDNPFLKIGLSAGSPVTDKNSFFEDSIKLAGRMSRILRGEIIVSSEVKELYDSENPKCFSDESGLFILTRADEVFLTQLMDYTESNWSDTNLKVDDFGKPLGYSKSRFYRKVVELTGDSPNVFIREYRLNEALALLNKNNSTVSEVAFDTGFSSPSYFSKCFQKRWGLSPSEYIPV